MKSEFGQKIAAVIAVGAIILIFYFVLGLGIKEEQFDGSVCPKCGGEFTVIDYVGQMGTVDAIIRCDDCHYTRSLDLDKAINVKSIWDREEN